MLTKQKETLRLPLAPFSLDVSQRKKLNVIFLFSFIFHLILMQSFIVVASTSFSHFFLSKIFPFNFFKRLYLVSLWGQFHQPLFATQVFGVKVAIQFHQQQCHVLLVDTTRMFGQHLRCTLRMLCAKTNGVKCAFRSLICRCPQNVGEINPWRWWGCQSLFVIAFFFKPSSPL